MVPEGLRISAPSKGPGIHLHPDRLRLDGLSQWWCARGRFSQVYPGQSVEPFRQSPGQRQTLECIQARRA
jgi:hypothetical protein